MDTSDVAFHRGNDYRLSTGIVVYPLGRMVEIIDLADDSTHQRHVDQIQYSNQSKFDGRYLEFVAGQLPQEEDNRIQAFGDCLQAASKLKQNPWTKHS